MIRKIKRASLVISSIGVGLVLAVVVPIWGWVIAAGLCLIFLGWIVAKNSCH